MHILLVKKNYLYFFHYKTTEIIFEMNIVICRFQQFVIPNSPFWYFLRRSFPKK